MRLILKLVPVITFLVSCNSNPDKQAELQKQANPSTKEVNEKTISNSIQTEKGKTILVTSNQQLVELVFDSISEAEFNKLKAPKFLRSINPQRKGNEFSIETTIRKHTFKKYRDYGEPENWCGYELLGYYPNLKLYALTENSTAEHMGFSELFLIDSITDYRYNIQSIGDDQVSIPIPSPDRKYFVYFYNWMYEHHNSEIGIIKINSKKNPGKYLEYHAEYSSDQFSVEQIVWKSNKCFYVKGFKETYDGNHWVKEFSYYQATFK